MTPVETIASVALIASSILSITGMALLAYGYRFSLFSKDDTTRWFVWSMVLLSTCFFWRRMFWDIIDPLVNGSGYEHPQAVNILFNLIAMAAVYCGLKARYYLVPEDERWRWTWLTAWAHPGLFRVRLKTLPEEERIIK